MSRLLQDVVGELSKLPGIGRRTALRLAIHILRMERESVAEMTESIDRFRNEVLLKNLSPLSKMDCKGTQFFGNTIYMRIFFRLFTAF